MLSPIVADPVSSASDEIVMPIQGSAASPDG